MVVAPFTYSHYRFILQTGLDNGYVFAGFTEIAQCRENNGRACFLRHDCDNDLIAAAAMARIEAELGVRSTYFLLFRSAMYNLMSIPNATLVREILAYGHWLGLHFDEQYYPQVMPMQLRAQVDRERGWVEDEFGVPVNVVSFHQPSPNVLDNAIKLNCLNTYDRVDMKAVHYLSDSNMIWKSGMPDTFFKSREYPLLQVLIHPEWWTDEEMGVSQKWNLMLRHNFDLMQTNLIQRERAYTQAHEIIFRERENAQV